MGLFSLGGGFKRIEKSCDLLVLMVMNPMGSESDQHPKKRLHVSHDL